MSVISVHDVQGFSTYNNTVRIPNGHKLDIAGDLVLPVHTTSTRPTAELGAIGFNSQTGELEVYVEINGTNQWYALTKAACQTIGLISMASNFAEKVTATIRTDSTAAMGIVHRQGVGRTRHIDVQYLWLQERVNNNMLGMGKVETKLTLADLMTNI